MNRITLGLIPDCFILVGEVRIDPASGRACKHRPDAPVHDDGAIYLFATIDRLVTYVGLAKRAKRLAEHWGPRSSFANRQRRGWDALDRDGKLLIFEKPAERTAGTNQSYHISTLLAEELKWMEVFDQGPELLDNIFGMGPIRRKRGLNARGKPL